MSGGLRGHTRELSWKEEGKEDIKCTTSTYGEEEGVLRTWIWGERKMGLHYYTHTEFYIHTMG